MNTIYNLSKQLDIHIHVYHKIAINHYHQFRQIEAVLTWVLSWNSPIFELACADNFLLDILFVTNFGIALKVSKFSCLLGSRVGVVNLSWAFCQFIPAGGNRIRLCEWIWKKGQFNNSNSQWLVLKHRTPGVVSVLMIWE